MSEEQPEHDGDVFSQIVRHDGIVTLHACDACVTPQRLIDMYEQAIREVRKEFGL